MLTAKRLPTVCRACRHALYLPRVRDARPILGREPVRPTLSSRALPLVVGSQSLKERSFSTSIGRQIESQEHPSKTADQFEGPPPDRSGISIEDSARNARQLYGDILPRGHLNEEAYAVYERLYGVPVLVDKIEHIQEIDGEGTEIHEESLPDGSTVLLRKGGDGELEEVEILDEFEEDVETEDAGGSTEDAETMTEGEWQDLKEQNTAAYHEEIYEQSRIAQQEALEEVEEEDDDFMRAHPLTIAGRSKPSPSTVFLPKEAFVDPVAALLTRANHKHLSESARRIFGGPGLPQSATTAAARLGRGQKPIPLDPSQSDLGNIEADAYMAAVMPGTYATVMSTLVEVRKRLGSSWAERLLKRKGGPLVLDAGAGGAGVIAWHEVLQAEWQRIHEESGATSHGSVPLGKASVITGSDTLRHRASQLLENTTFIPRLPDSTSADEENNSQQPRKLYDLIIAPHTLWSLRQEYQRKEQVDKYWSLLNPKGGVLILTEKGLPRGFEVIAAARQHLLDKHIASFESIEIEVPLEQQVSKPDEDTRFAQKETGMIIAPCTNHNSCPMYETPGVSQGRKDFCFFSQRYIRPPYLQRILSAKDRNHEDVQFSYVAVQRGRDQRLPLHDIVGQGVIQNEQTTNMAFDGHEWKAQDEPLTPADVNPLSFPRLVLPALKRRGHIVLDVCTPAGKLERWTVPRSFSKQAYRDARKVRWGDLWALGAKTRIPKNVRLGRPSDEFDRKGRRIKAPKKQIINVDVSERGFEGFSARTDGRYTQDRKIRGSGGRKGRKKPITLDVDDLE
ncbi:37S ribosomal protein-like protein Rsm22 [Lophiostoma macrostomum CBS 122681]|uniref:37S ribosomal protein-like protein Rsm22 n=1 Tax=Lophiostoma macrostomum CBS 122681 TaxID=1314788 RepID=A0A6A6TH11_9PLEO|nr:37S ribosomal protein-like protein Rsm22 [Lophiostoma macrostomum CBS 122681]